MAGGILSLGQSLIIGASYPTRPAPSNRRRVLTCCTGMAILTGMKHSSTSVCSRVLPVFSIVVLLLGASVLPVSAGRNLLPRLPQVVIEKGFSDAFQVTSCVVNAEVVNDAVSSKVSLELKNVSAEPLKTSLKVRLLYLANDQAVKIQVNGKHIPFDRKQGRLPLSLAAGETLTLVINARQNILYNLDAMKAEAERQKDEDKNFRKFALDELTKLFGRENFGRRLMIGPFVSKWGVFPVTFEKVSIEVKIPREFVMIAPPNTAWQVQTTSRNQVCTFNGTDEYAGTVFLPSTDEAAFRAWQKSDQETAGKPTGR